MTRFLSTFTLNTETTVETVDEYSIIGRDTASSKNYIISYFSDDVTMLSVLFVLFEGANANNSSVWRVVDEGTKEKLTAWYEDRIFYWDVRHLSNFVIWARTNLSPA